MTEVKAQRKFGVPHRIIHRDAEELMKNMGFATKEIFHEFCTNEANFIAVEESVNHMEFGTSGSEPYIASETRNYIVIFWPCSSSIWASMGHK